MAAAYYLLKDCKKLKKGRKYDLSPRKLIFIKRKPVPLFNERISP